MSQPSTILSVDGVSLSFGGNAALSDVSFDVCTGEIRAIIGPNGAGKTSLLNCMSGFYRPDKGHIMFQGHPPADVALKPSLLEKVFGSHYAYDPEAGGYDMTQVPAHHVASLGMARTFQNIALYTGLSTLDNLMAARHVHMHQNAVESVLYWGKAVHEEVEHREFVEEIIDFLEIAHIRKAIVGALPYGLRKRVELGRALALEPTLLLLDEPMAGMNVEEKEDMARFILDIHEQRGITIILIEHDMGLVMDISNRVVVIDFGVKIADGTPQEVKYDERVIHAYLGQE